MDFRVVGPDHEVILAEVFAQIDETFFRPQPFTPEEAPRIAVRTDCQGLCLGPIMMESLHRAADERSARTVRLRVHADNTRVRRPARRVPQHRHSR